MKGKYIIGISLLIAFVVAFSAASAMDGVDASEKPDIGANMIPQIVWQVPINIDDGTLVKGTDNVVMGEALDGVDGGVDPHDAPHSPFPPPPYLQAYFDDGLSAPYNQLSADFRKYCDGIPKTWVLTVAVNGGGSLFNITWNPADFAPSEYASVYLRDAGTGTILADMLATGTYVETITADPGFYNYDITCENATCPTLGDNCYNPYNIDIPADLDYAVSHSTIGFNDDYFAPNGADAVYFVDVTEEKIVDIILDNAPSGAVVALYDDCPNSGTLLASATVAKGTATIDGYTIAVGEYYLLVDGGSFTYDLFITLVHDVGVTAINLPTLPVYNDTTVPVQVQVENFGNDETGVPVHVWIEDGGAAPPPVTCDYEICLDDTYGDTWNGGTLDVLVNGVPVLTGLEANDYTPGVWQCWTFTVEDGDTIDLDYTYFSFPYENVWELYDSDGILVHAGSGGYSDTAYDSTHIASCTPKTVVYDNYEFISINSGDSIAVDFPDWYVDHGENYTIYAQTELPTDQNNANNQTFMGPFYVEPGLHDVGFISVDTPDDHIIIGQHEICGTVENFGDFDEVGVPVRAQVYYLGEAVAPSDLPFMEDFETASTAWSDWTVVETPANGDTWVRSTDYGYVDDGGATGYAAVMDDDGYGSASDNPREELISPIISCAGESGVMLDFNGDFEDMATYGIFWVNVSGDGGSTWTNVLFQTTDLDPGGYGTGFDMDPRLPIDISAIADGQSEVQIKFTYSDCHDTTGISGYAWGAMVDDIHVYATPITGQGLTKDDPFAGKEFTLIYEAYNTVDVAEGATAQVCFTPDALFGENGFYMINLTTMLPTDQFPDNDTASRTVRAVVDCVQNMDTGVWWTTIQEAVDDASEGDTLGAMCKCYYNERVVIEKDNIQIIKHPLAEAADPDCMPVLDGNISGNQGIGFNISARGVNISGFEIIDCTFGVFVYYGDGSVTNCSIHDNGVGIGIKTPYVGSFGVNYNHFYSNGCGVVNYPAPIKLPPAKDKDVILDEHFEGTWVTSSDPDDPIPYEVPVDATYGEWDIDGLCVDSQGGYPQLTHYIAQTEDYGGYGLPYDGTYCAGCWWSDGTGGDYVQDEWLKTPVMDLTGGSNLELSFYGIWCWSSTYTDSVYIKASTDGGSTWTELADLLNDPAYEQGSGGPAGYGWCWNEYQVVLDVSAYASAQTQFAYQVYGDGSTMYGINYIDAFVLTGDLGPTYTLTVDVIGSGTVELTPPGGVYPEDTVVQLEAIADPNWDFLEWQGDLTGSANPTTIIMDSDKFVTAVFEAGIPGVPSEDGIHYNWFGYCKPPWDPGCLSPGCAIHNMDNDTILDATYNWFEAPDGPSGGIIDPMTGTVADGLGNMIYGPMYFDPWMGIDAQMVLDQGGNILIPGCHEMLTVEAGVPIFFDGSGSFGAKFFWMFQTADIELDYYWSFGDQYFSTEESTSHTYDSPGVYDVYLRVSANDLDVWPYTMYDWCRATLNVVGPDSPLAANADGGGLGTYQTVVKEEVQLYGQATGGSLPYTYYWSFGDGTPEEIGQSPTHTYMTEGTYTATLIVQDATGQTARDEATVVVAGIDDLVANAGGPYEGAPDEAVYIRGSAFGGIAPYTYNWNLGDGSSANGDTIVHIYEQEGTYTVTLTVTDSEGTVDEHTATVTIVEDHTDAQIKDVKGGLGIKATIVAGDVPIDWSVTVNGKYIFMGGEATGHIQANAIETIKTPFTFAIGTCDVTIIAGTTTEQIEVLMIGPFAILK